MPVLYAPAGGQGVRAPTRVPGRVVGRGEPMLPAEEPGLAGGPWLAPLLGRGREPRSLLDKWGSDECDAYSWLKTSWSPKGSKIKMKHGWRIAPVSIHSGLSSA